MDNLIEVTEMGDQERSYIRGYVSGSQFLAGSVSLDGVFLHLRQEPYQVNKSGRCKYCDRLNVGATVCEGCGAPL